MNDKHFFQRCVWKHRSFSMFQHSSKYQTKTKGSGFWSCLGEHRRKHACLLKLGPNPSFCRQSSRALSTGEQCLCWYEVVLPLHRLHRLPVLDCTVYQVLPGYFRLWIVYLQRISLIWAESGRFLIPRITCCLVFAKTVGRIPENIRNTSSMGVQIKMKSLM